MNLFFLPFVRQGLTPVANAGARAHVSVAFRLESQGQPARDIARTLTLLGPGDVVAIEPWQILRVSPAAGAHAAEPDFFPLIEFDAPELPWAYSPTLPAGARRAVFVSGAQILASPIGPSAPGRSAARRRPARSSRHSLNSSTPSLV